MAFGEWLRIAIGRGEGMTPAAFARAVGVKHPSVLNWIAGRDKPRPNRIPKIAEVLDVPEAVVWAAWRDGAEPSQAQAEEMLALIRAVLRMQEALAQVEEYGASRWGVSLSAIARERPGGGRRQG